MCRFVSILLDIHPTRGIFQRRDGPLTLPYMKSVRIISMTLLALLYLGGACAHACALTFTPTGTGDKAYSNFRGLGKEPPCVTVLSGRRISAVKPISVSPAVVVNQPEFGESDQFQILLQPCFGSSPVNFCSLCRNDRAPPLR